MSLEEDWFLMSQADQDKKRLQPADTGPLWTAPRRVLFLALWFPGLALMLVGGALTVGLMTHLIGMPALIFGGFFMIIAVATVPSRTSKLRIEGGILLSVVGVALQGYAIVFCISLLPAIHGEPRFTNDTLHVFLAIGSAVLAPALIVFGLVVRASARAGILVGVYFAHILLVCGSMWLWEYWYLGGLVGFGA